jgi:hypothetical protein
MLGDRKAALILFLIFCSVFVSLPNIAAVRATEDYWTTKVPLPVARAGFKAAAVNEKIYVMKLNITYEYNLYSWSTKTSMPTPRDDFAVAVVNDQIYTVGGLTGAFVVTEQKNQNEQYTPIGYIPEFPSWAPLVFALCTVAVVLVVYKLELCKTQSLESEK